MNDPVAVLNWFTEKWHKPYTAIGIFLLGLAGTFYIWPEIESRTVSISQVVISFFVGLSLLGFWIYTHRVPKIKPGNLGFTIAITGETENERAVVSSDFVSASKEVLEGLGQDPAFQIIELSRYHAEKIVDVEAAQIYREKSGSNFLLFGTAKRRPVKGKDHYVLKLRGLVTHAPIPIEKSKLLAQEMDKVLPLEFRVACEDSLDGFEVNSLWFAESAKFVIASAALLSGDFLLAKRLLENLKQSGGRLNKHKKKSGIKALFSLLPKRLANTYFALSQQHHYLWRETRDPSHLDEMKNYVDRFNEYEPGTAHYHVSTAIWLFVRKRDVEAAKKEIFKCAAKKVSDPTWRLNAAFLYAYSGDMKKAVELYDTAFSLGRVPEISFELEEFIDWALANEPDKYQLHFCLGLINLKLKNDALTATRDFERFLTKLDTDKYPELKVLAQRYIDENNVGQAKTYFEACESAFEKVAGECA
jgi:tetratricopeptide (TPR) repeat protein